MDGFTPNVCIVDEEYAGTLEAYDTAGLAIQKKVTTNFEPLWHASMTTKSGLHGIYNVYRMQTQSTMLRDVQYIFAGKGNTKYVVTYSIPESQGTQYDAAIQDSAATFALQ